MRLSIRRPAEMRASRHKEHPKGFGLLESLVHFNNDQALHLDVPGWSVDSTRERRHGYRMNRSVRVGVQLLVLAVAGVVGGFMAGSQTTRTVDADPGQMSALVPMMTQADLAAQDVAVSSTDLATTSITPVRIIDTRRPGAALGGTAVPWGALETRTVDAAGLGPIPADAVGVVLNVTALNATEQGTFLTLFPTGVEMPNASTLNPTPGEIAYNAATVLLGPDGTFEVYNYAGSVDVIIDVTAYMTRELADSVDTVETEVDDVETEVGRLQTGEFLPSLRSIAGVVYSISTQDWAHYAAADPDGFFGAPVPEGRYSPSAMVQMEVAIDPIMSNDFNVCFRVNSSTDGLIAESEVCADSSTETAADGVVFLQSPMVPLPSGTLSVFAKVTGDEVACAGGYMSPCSATMDYFGFRVFDN